MDDVWKTQFETFFLEVRRCDDVKTIVRLKFVIWWFVWDLFLVDWYEYESLQWMHTFFAPNYDFLMSLSLLQFSKFFNFLKKNLNQNEMRNGFWRGAEVEERRGKCMWLQLIKLNNNNVRRISSRIVRIYSFAKNEKYMHV